ncbi:MAG: uridine monophosphate synthetase [Spirochaetes bacterium]|nr:MAG: uridine monophosphate synthetase [Spirochaetota bacterium]
MNFFDSLDRIAREKGSCLCVGLDPNVTAEERKAKGDDACIEAALASNKRLIDATAPYAACYKPNLAFYETFGSKGFELLEKTLAAIPSDIPFILDAKRGDIDNTAAAYAESLFGHFKAPAVTLSPFMGLDTLDPFLAWKDRGIFALCRTSNPGSDFIQALAVGKEPLYVSIARSLAEHSDRIGLVVAGNDPTALAHVRSAAPQAWFLSPGIGAQGGRADLAVSAGARADGLGILVVAARSVAKADDPGLAAKALRDSMAEISRSAKAQSSYSGCKSGKKSPFYIDLRRLISDPRAMDCAAKAYAAMAEGIPYDSISGIPAAALPLATAACMRLRSPMIWPRMPVKDHGTGNRVEGRFNAGEKILLLDDLITTGASKLEALDILRSENLVVEDLVVLIERGKQGRIDMEKAGVRLHAFIHVREIFEILESQGIIGKAEKAALLAFIDAE